MLLLVKLFPEITIKSRPVRKRFIRQLRKNLKSVLTPLADEVVVRGEWDSLEVELSGIPHPEAIIERFACTPGISLFLEVERFDLPDIDTMLELTLARYQDQLDGKTFAVRCKRMGTHAFSSVDVERFIGAGLNTRTGAAGVNLSNPDVTVALEIRDNTFYVVTRQHRGLGGFPLGCQDAVLSLLSGGFDSAVSSYLCMGRGLQTHYCFFNLGGKAHELAVKELALFLWMKYHSSHRVKFVSVPFEGVVAEILQQVDNAQMGVVLKRMMLRAADRVAQEMGIQALVTGESVAQVSSQTLINLSVIDKASEMLVLRPLATMDKQGIIDLAREIGTEQFSKHIPEYCAVISKNPTTKARMDRIEREESRFNFQLLDDAIANSRAQLITQLAEDIGMNSPEVEVVHSVANGSIVIDIRHPTEVESSPLQLEAAAGSILNIPFYTLRTQFDDLDPKQPYLLYCDQGMMSRLHAAHLRDEGFTNVAVLDLK